MLTERISEDIDNKAILLADNIAASIIFNDQQTASDTLFSLRNDSTVRYSGVYDIDDLLFAEYKRDPGPAVDVPEVLEPGIYMEEQYVEVIRPVIFKQGQIGTILIRSDLTDLNNMIVQYGYIVIFVFLISMMLAALLSQNLQRLISGPIEQLARLAEEISKDQNYTRRLDLNRSDELGILINSFNAMLAVIEDRESELKDHTDHLEHLVMVRSEQLHKHAYYDSLTELPNRNMLYERLNQEISQSKRDNKLFALLYLDLDRFKTINDSLGHNVGDELLSAVAKRLTEVVRKNDLIVRLGGDEFVILLSNISSPNNASIVAESVVSVFSNPFELSKSGATLHISASIGISIFPKDGDDTESIMRNSDASMYEAKSRGPGKFSFYEKGMNATSHRQLEIENYLREALNKNEFYLCYQPQFSLVEDMLIGMEALIRWDNPVLGQIFPREFILLAEEIGIINEITLWVINTACRQNKLWQDAGMPPMVMAVNVSATHLFSVDIVKQIKQALDLSGLKPEYLEIEITEDIFLDDTDRIMRNLNEIKEIGVKLAIDDFGTGYSSLSYLQSFPVDTLKLDGSFIRKIGENPASENLVSATINLAHSLNLKLVAESVETQGHLDFLREKGCDIIQGYFYSKPLTKEKFEKFMADQGPIGNLYKKAN